MWYIHCSRSICCYYWLQVLSFSPLLLPVANVRSVCGRIRNFFGLIDGLFLDVTTVHRGIVSAVRLQGLMQHMHKF